MLIGGSSRAKVQGFCGEVLVQVMYRLGALWTKDVDDVASEPDELHGVSCDVRLSWSKVIGGKAFLCCIV